MRLFEDIVDNYSDEVMNDAPKSSQQVNTDKRPRELFD